MSRPNGRATSRKANGWRVRGTHLSSRTRKDDSSLRGREPKNGPSEGNRAVLAQGEAVQLAGAAGRVVVVVGDVEEAVVGRHQEAVGPLQLTSEDAGDPTVGVNAVNTF